MSIVITYLRLIEIFIKNVLCYYANWQNLFINIYLKKDDLSVYIIIVDLYF